MRLVQTGAMIITPIGFSIDFATDQLALTNKDMAILAITRQPWFW